MHITGTIENTLKFEDIDARILLGQNIPINPKHFVQHPLYPLKASDYLVRSYKSGSGLPNPSEINFMPEITPYALILTASRNDRRADVAICGFAIIEDVIDCRQLQGGRRRYLELSRIAWEYELMDNLIAIGISEGFREIRMIPASKLRIIDRKDEERLVRRYDDTARAYGFNYSANDRRHILELK